MCGTSTEPVKGHLSPESSVETLPGAPAGLGRFHCTLPPNLTPPGCGLPGDPTGSMLVKPQHKINRPNERQRFAAEHMSLSSDFPLSLQNPKHAHQEGPLSFPATHKRDSDMSTVALLFLPPTPSVQTSGLLGDLTSARGRGAKLGGFCAPRASLCWGARATCPRTPGSEEHLFSEAAWSRTVGGLPTGDGPSAPNLQTGTSTDFDGHLVGCGQRDLAQSADGT